jgi:hypothetical protein
MPTTNGKEVLDQLLEPVSRCLTPGVAKSLLDLRAPPHVQARVEELADKCTEEKLSPEEESEYDAYVWAGNLIAILQAKARALLAHEA